MANERKRRADDQEERMARAVKGGADLQRERGRRGLTAEDIHMIYLTEGIASPGVAVIEERMANASRLGLVRPAGPGDTT